MNIRPTFQFILKKNLRFFRLLVEILDKVNSRESSPAPRQKWREDFPFYLLSSFLFRFCRVEPKQRRSEFNETWQKDVRRLVNRIFNSPEMGSYLRDNETTSTNRLPLPILLFILGGKNRV